MGGSVTTDVLEIPDRQRPAAPVPPSTIPGPLALWRAIRDNSITALPEAVYDQPVFELDLPRSPLIVSDPAAIERISITRADNYIRGEFQQRRVRPLFGSGILTAEGDTWKTGRRTANPALSPRAIMPWLAGVRTVTEATADEWSQLGETPVDIFEAFLTMSFRIISRSAFSGDFDAQQPAILRHSNDYFRALGRVDLATLLQLPDWLPTIGGLRARRSIGALRRIVDEVVQSRVRARRAAAMPAGDLLDRLLDVSSDELPVVKGEFVRDNVLSQLMAGHETSATALTWTAYLLARFPWADERLADEVSNAGLGATPGPDDLNRLTFARCVIDEALRLYPPVPILTRKAIAEDEICGVRIRPGREIVVSPWVVHRHHRLWEEPELFAPDRFRDRRAIPRGAYIPFGAGPRICIGQTFAIYELLTVLLVLVPRFRFELPAGTDIEPLARITLQPRGGLLMRIVPR